MTARLHRERALEDVLASLRRVEAALDDANARLARPPPEEPAPAPIRTLHRLP